MRSNAPQLGRTRHRGTVVARGMRRDAALRSFIIESKNGIRCPACLKGTDLLKILAFKKQRCPARVIQPRIRQDRCAMNVRVNPFVRFADRIQTEYSN